MKLNLPNLNADTFTLLLGLQIWGKNGAMIRENDALAYLYYFESSAKANNSLFWPPFILKTKPIILDLKG